MSVFQFNTGVDATISIVTPNGPLRVSILTSFNPRQESTNLRSKGIDGNNYFAEIPMGWQIDFKVDKASDNLDAFFAAYEAAYYAGATLQGATISVIISNPDNSISEYQFTGCAFKFDNGGSFAGDQKVEQTFSVRANKRLKVM